MPRHFFSLRIAALVILAGIAVAAVDLHLRGFAVVRDDARLLQAAAIVGDDGSRPMRSFERGYWAGRPRGDGALELRCRNGVVVRRGYVTPGARTTYTVTTADCRPPR